MTLKNLVLSKSRLYGVVLIAIALIVAEHNSITPRHIAMYVLDEMPDFHARFQQGVSLGVGTPLGKVDATHLMVALSTPKYNAEHNSHIYLVGKTRQDIYQVLGQTPTLPAAADPQAVTVFENELIVANHQDKSTSIAIYDLGAAFSGTLKLIGAIPNIPSPTNVLIHGNRLYITCYGEGKKYGQGIYVYEKNAVGEWRQVQRFLYRDIFGRHLFRNNYRRWLDLGPISIAIRDNIAYVSNIYSSSVMMLDLTLPAKKALISRIAGAATRIHYPLGLVFYQDQLFVADHNYDYILAFDEFSIGGEIAPKQIFTDTTHAMNPYGLLAQDDNIFVANLANSNIYIFPIMANGLENPHFIAMPDHATITSMALVTHAF